MVDIGSVSPRSPCWAEPSTRASLPGRRGPLETEGTMSEPSAAQPSDRELLDQHCAGDRGAFGVLVRRHQDRLWRVALRTLGNPEDAADALQDALLSAFRAAHGFRGDAAVTTWLHRIVVNACLDLARRRASRPTTPLDSATLATTDPVTERET